MRVCIGPFKLRLCSGFLHRISTLQVAASYYDYPPYYTPKPDLPLQDLLPPSEEDFDALNEFIPSRSMRITFFAPTIELELMDHPYFKPSKGNLFKKRKVSFFVCTYNANNGSFEKKKYVNLNPYTLYTCICSNPVKYFLFFRKYLLKIHRPVFL